jgi:hypothetical protein
MSNPLAISKTGNSNYKPKNSTGLNPKQAAMAAAKEAAQKAAGASPAALIRYIPAAECKDRNRIVFDDSGSMCDQIKDAKRGVVEFLRNCIPNQTSVAIHFMETKPDLPLQSDLVALGNALLEKPLHGGGTPLFKTLKTALEATPKLTRLIAFTDGSPSDRLQPETITDQVNGWNDGRTDFNYQSADVIIKLAHAIGTTDDSHCSFPIPIDTVFFGDSRYNQREMKLLKYLSAETGGFFLHFDPTKPNIWKQMKYLSPSKRLMLTSPDFRAQVERGES